MDFQRPLPSVMFCSFLTATTIIVLMLFVADMDDVTRGLFTVDVTSLTTAYHIAERHFTHVGGNTDEPPPEPAALDAMIAEELARIGVPKPEAW